METRPTTIDTVTVTYDALGRMVEQAKSSSYTQIVYDALGHKLALMNGTSTVVKAFTLLPGGATVVYNASGLQYYRHPDWLGSSRFSSTPSRTMYNDLAFAPFGETYAPSGSAGVTDISFAGMNEDTTTNEYDAVYREYGIQGRGPSPDPAGVAAANPSNPQSWNRYAYVMNNPLAFIDPLGLMPNHGCFVAGHQGRGVPNYGNCGPPTGGSNCDIDGALVPCGGGDGSGGGGGGFGSIQNCTGEVPYWQSCTALYIFSLPTGTGGPGSGDLCGGGDCSNPQPIPIPIYPLLLDAAQQGYAQCANAATAAYNQNTNDNIQVSEWTSDQAGENDPLGPIGPSSLYPNNGQPELNPNNPNAGGWALIIGSLWASHVYNKALAACREQNPLPLAPPNQ